MGNKVYYKSTRVRSDINLKGQNLRALINKKKRYPMIDLKGNLASSTLFWDLFQGLKVFYVWRLGLLRCRRLLRWDNCYVHSRRFRYETTGD